MQRAWDAFVGLARPVVAFVAVSPVRQVLAIVAVAAAVALVSIAVRAVREAAQEVNAAGAASARATVGVAVAADRGCAALADEGRNAERLAAAAFALGRIDALGEDGTHRDPAVRNVVALLEEHMRDAAARVGADPRAARGLGEVGAGGARALRAAVAPRAGRDDDPPLE